MWRHLVQLNQSINVPFLTILYPASLPLFFGVIKISCGTSFTGDDRNFRIRYLYVAINLMIISLFLDV